MRDKIHFWHVDVDTSNLPAPALPWFLHICLFHDPFQPLVDDVIEQLVPTIEQHYRSLTRRFVGAASFVELRDGAIHGGFFILNMCNTQNLSVSMRGGGNLGEYVFLNSADSSSLSDPCLQH